MNAKRYFFVLAVVLLSLISLFSYNRHSGSFIVQNIKYVELAGQKISVELAISQEELVRGLSGRIGLNTNTGMLFVFPIRASKFWMKGMNFPLDIIWINKNMRVVYVKKDAEPKDFPETYGPEDEARYVLEVSAGFVDRYGLQVGDEVKFTE